MQKDFMKQLFFIAFFLTSFYSQAQVNLNKNDLEELRNRLEGNFDNIEQSKADFSYQNISLHIKEIELKGKHPEGYFLYAEQSGTGTDQSIRQWIYHIYKQDKQTLVVKAYELNQPEQYAAGWSNTEKFKNLRFSDLVEKTGCAIYLNKDEQGNFYGGSFCKECTDHINGAAYTISELIVYPSMLISWDRGYDKNDKQIRGAEKGGYKFRKWTSPRKPKND